MLWLLYFWEKSPPYSLDRMLDGTKSQSGCCGVEKNLLLCWELNLWPSSLWPVPITEWAIPAPHIYLNKS
jgi:hypothetical protein